MPESNFPISCFACDPATMHKGDAAYLAHMQSAHGGMTPGQAMNQQKAIDQNIPKEIPLVKDAPPSKEFMEIAQMMDQPQQSTTPSRPAAGTLLQMQKSPPPVVQEIRAEESKSLQEEYKPITLKYKYEGNCKICNVPVRTIMVKVGNRLFATAYCLMHEELIQIEVHPIREEIGMTPDEINDMYKNTDARIVQKEMMDDSFYSKGEVEVALERTKKNGFVDPFEEIANRDIRLHKEYIDKEKIEKLLMERRKKASARYKKPKSKLAEVVDKDE